MDWCERGFLTIDGVRLEYSCIGPQPSDAPTAIFLHEGLGCVDLWRDFPKKLSKTIGCGVFTYSRQSYGASDPVPLPRPLNYMTLEAINVLPKILEHLSPTQFQLIGHSDGATIAAIFAGDIGHDKLSAVTLIAPHFFTEDMGITQIKAAKHAFETTDLPEKLGKYHRDAENAFYGWNQSWLHPDFRSWDVQDVIEKITTPILAIQGMDDQYGTLQQIESIKARARVSVSLKILQDCKHSPHLEHPSKVLDMIKTFSTAVR
jgi:pimeloyl-ACP methyl ester carboxylesterase